MLNDRGFFGPAQYEGWPLYLVIGVLLVALVVAWFVFVVRFSRARMPPERVDAPRPPVDPATLKSKYAGLIDEVAAEHRAGRLDDRGVAGRLSLLLRFFASESSGVDAQVMTLSDLRSASLPSVAGAVERYYAPEFARLAPDADTDPATAVELAREVVRSWN